MFIYISDMAKSRKKSTAGKINANSKHEGGGAVTSGHTASPTAAGGTAQAAAVDNGIRGDVPAGPYTLMDMDVQEDEGNDHGQGDTLILLYPISIIPPDLPRSVPSTCRLYIFVFIYICVYIHRYIHINPHI
jgi:hypothetical protein